MLLSESFKEHLVAITTLVKLMEGLGACYSVNKDRDSGYYACYILCTLLAASLLLSIQKEI